MFQEPLISIIIPTYNRANLIGDTLGSVLAQTYTNWECIVVDDGSTDTTEEVLLDYLAKDKRFQYYKRPNNYLSGGNGARNYGFEKSNGAYINWFDSDDLMFPDFIEFKVEKALSNPESDFVVTRGQNFFKDGKIQPLNMAQNLKYELNHNNFVLFNVFWITHDFFCKKASIGNVRFDEEIKSGQEYNFFIKVMAVNSLKGKYYNKILFNRRMHDTSIQGKLSKGTMVYHERLLQLYLKTFSQTKAYLSPEARNHMFRRIPSNAYEIKAKGGSLNNYKKLLQVFRSEKGGSKTMLFIFSLILASIFGKGYGLMNKARK